VSGDFEERVWVQEWIEAAATKRALRDNCLGYLGHYYPGMLDMYTDLTMRQGQLGAHTGILEMCDLAARVHQVTEAGIDARGTAGGKAPKYRQEIIVPTCLSLTESITALAREVSLGMSGSL
jgi:hypothetical protein